MSLKRKTSRNIEEMCEITNLSKKCKLSDYDIDSVILHNQVVEIKSKIVELPEKNKDSKNRKINRTTGHKMKKEHIKRIKSSDTSDPHEYVLASPPFENNFHVTISEILIAIDAIRKNKQRASLDKIYSFLIKDYPYLQMHQINSIIDESIKLGTIETHVHNGFCSYRKSEGRLEPISLLPALDFTKRKDVLNAIKDLFQLHSRFSLDNIETLLMKKYNFYNVNGISLRKRLNQACNYLIKNGSLIFMDNLYNLVNSSSTNNEHNNNVATFNVEKVSQNNYSNSDSKKIQSEILKNHDSLNCSNDLEGSDKETHKNILRSKNLELSLLFDSLTNFFTVSGDKRRSSMIKKQDPKILDKKLKFKGPKRHKKNITHNATIKIKPLFIEHENKEALKPNKIRFHKKISNSNKFKNQKYKSTSTQTCMEFDDKFMDLNSDASEEKNIIIYEDDKEVTSPVITDEDLNFFSLAKTTGEQRLFQNTSTLTPTIKVLFGRYELISNMSIYLPPEYSRLEKVVICEFCLEIMATLTNLERHLLKCKKHGPVGLEIYRSEDVSVFCVDKHTSIDEYITNLNTFEHVFSNTTMKSINFNEHNEKIKERRSYVSTIRNRSGWHFVGALTFALMSKDKWVLKNILILPPHRYQGHAKLIIRLGYCLAAKLKATVYLDEVWKYQSANQKLFLSVWKLIIAEHFYSTKNLSYNILDLCKVTAINIENIIMALKSMHLINEISDPISLEDSVNISIAQMQTLSPLKLKQKETSLTFDSNCLLKSADLTFPAINIYSNKNIYQTPKWTNYTENLMENRINISWQFFLKSIRTDDESIFGDDVIIEDDPLSDITSRVIDRFFDVQTKVSNDAIYFDNNIIENEIVQENLLSKFDRNIGSSRYQNNQLIEFSESHEESLRLSGGSPSPPDLRLPDSSPLESCSIVGTPVAEKSNEDEEFNIAHSENSAVHSLMIPDNSYSDRSVSEIHPYDLAFTARSNQYSMFGTGALYENNPQDYGRPMQSLIERQIPGVTPKIWSDEINRREMVNQQRLSDLEVFEEKKFTELKSVKKSTLERPRSNISNRPSTASLSEDQSPEAPKQVIQSKKMMIKDGATAALRSDESYTESPRPNRPATCSLETASTSKEITAALRKYVPPNTLYKGQMQIDPQRPSNCSLSNQNPFFTQSLSASNMARMQHNTPLFVDQNISINKSNLQQGIKVNKKSKSPLHRPSPMNNFTTPNDSLFNAIYHHLPELNARSAVLQTSPNNQIFVENHLARINRSYSQAPCQMIQSTSINANPQVTVRPQSRDPVRENTDMVPSQQMQQQQRVAMLLHQQQQQQNPAYLYPAAYLARLQQFRCPTPFPYTFSPCASSSPIDMSLTLQHQTLGHPPTNHRPRETSRKSNSQRRTNIQLQQDLEHSGHMSVIGGSGHKILNFGPYPVSSVGSMLAMGQLVAPSETFNENQSRSNETVGDNNQTPNENATYANYLTTTGQRLSDKFSANEAMRR